MSETALPAIAAVEEVEPAESLPPCCTAPGRFAHLAAASKRTDRFAFEKSDHGVRVLIDGKLFAEYRTGTPHQPTIWPIIGPSGHEMTRSYPLGAVRPAERTDHPHHESLWFSHGNVNGYDFWLNKTKIDLSKRPRIKHRETVSHNASESTAVIVTANDWVAAGELQLTDQRTVTFGLLPDETGSAARYIDFAIELHASQGAVDFGDTKEGTFGIRIPGPMKIDAGFGGKAFNSNGEQGRAAWGQPASWVAYQGPLAVPDDDEDAPLGGIVIMSHPDGYNPKCRWHVRSYGLFAANPFGVKDFPNDGSEAGGYLLNDGETLTMRYRVVFHAGRVGTPLIDAWYNRFAATDRIADHHRTTSP